MGNRCDVQCRYRFNILKKAKDFQERIVAVAAKVYSNPAVAGPPLLPVKPVKPHKTCSGNYVKKTRRLVTLPVRGKRKKNEMFSTGEEEVIEEFLSPDASGQFEESGSDDFDDSD
jgi:hypothetical protein